MAELYIIPECYVDTNLLETLVPTAKGYNHQKGCNNVVKVMKEKLADEFAVNLFQELKNADEVVVLKKALKYLKENKYQSDPEKLKVIIEGI